MWLNLYFGSAFALFVLSFLLFLLRGKGTFSFVPWAIICGLVAVPATAAVYFLNQALHFLG